MIDFQSSPCPSGTFENSPVIYDWVHRPLKTQSPAGTTEILRFSILLSTFAPLREISGQRKRAKLRNEPNFQCKLLSIKKICALTTRQSKSNLFKAHSQSLLRPSR